MVPPAPMMGRESPFGGGICLEICSNVSYKACNGVQRITLQGMHSVPLVIVPILSFFLTRDFILLMVQKSGVHQWIW